MLAQIREELDTLWSSPSKRETAGFRLSLVRLMKPRKCDFCQVSAVNLWREPRIKDTCPFVSCSQATAAYKYPVNSPERELDRKQRAEYFIACATLVVLLLHHCKFSLGFIQKLSGEERVLL